MNRAISFVLILASVFVPGCGRDAPPKMNDQSVKRFEFDDKMRLALEQQADIEKQRADLEKAKAELEKQKRELAEAELRLGKERMAQELKKKAFVAEDLRKVDGKELTYSDEEMRLVQDATQKGADSLGRFLLGGTHPTGLYVRTGVPLCSLSLDRQRITITVNVEWQGSVSGANYQTTYSMAFNKREGLEYLKVLNDSAVFQIDPQYLRATEAALKDVIRAGK